MAALSSNLLPCSFPDSCSLTLQVCLVGASRNYLQSDEAQAEQRRADYIQSRRAGSAARVRGQGSDTTNNVHLSEQNQDSAVVNPRNGWGAGFQPRDKVETVRNCAALPRDFVEAVVLQVATVLLDMTAGNSHPGDWNPGGKDRSHSAQQRWFCLTVHSC